jgi:hypothetical protein
MPTYAPNLVYVPCQTGTGVIVQVPDAAIWGRHYIPQPFLQSLSGTTFAAIFLPDASVTVPYECTLFTNLDSVATILTGALPPGLALSHGSFETLISGTPTTTGTYDFTLRFLAGTIATDVPFEIYVGPAPSGDGGGFVSGI